MDKAKKVFDQELGGFFTEQERSHIWTEIMHANYPIEQEEVLEEVIERLLENEPYQYIIGRSFFYNHEFIVNKHVLIPRPETEELVHKVYTDFKGLSPKILDIGTGSGCIAVSLAKLLPAAEVYALDVSPHALEIADKNAKELNATVQYFEADIRTHHPEMKFDVMVSNPPYIPLKEKELMADNVLNYEPGLALFVEDENPLEFYEVIAAYAISNLTNNGRLYVEINEHYGQEVKNLFNEIGFQNVKLHQDMQGKDRMVVGEKK